MFNLDYEKIYDDNLSGKCFEIHETENNDFKFIGNYHFTIISG